MREFPQKHQFQTLKHKYNSIMANITSNFENFHTSNKVSGNFPLGSKLKRELKQSRGILVLPSLLKTGGIGLKIVAYNDVVSLRKMKRFKAPHRVAEKPRIHFILFLKRLHLHKHTTINYGLLTIHALTGKLSS